jgi:EAL and modified HD-GYP domain-containing signal transduction protein
MTSSVYLGRQPILDRRGRTYAFELLYRDSSDNSAFFADPDDATRRVIEAAMLEWGFDRLIGDRLGFINAAGGLLHTGLLSILPAGRTIVEVLEGVVLDDAMVQVIREAHATGLRFALDDVVDLDREGLTEVAPLIDVVKLDVLGIPPLDLASTVERSRAMFPNALLLAEKVEDPAKYAECMELGFDLFQGYFFAKPETLERSGRPNNVSTAILLLAEVTRPDVDIDRIEGLISADPSLAYSILRLVNSSSFGLNSRVQSIRHAIVMVGFVQVRQLAVLLTMAKNSRAISDEIIVLAAVRAQMAGQLAGTSGLAGGAFTTGLLSVIDTVFATPMDELLTGLPLPTDVRDALLEGSGPLGALMDIVYAFERADMDELESLRPGEADVIREHYAKSVAWAENVRAELLSN